MSNTEEKDPAREALEQYATQLGRTLAPVFAEIKRIMETVASALAEVIAQVVNTWEALADWEFVLAYVWAQQAHPKWVAILNRTKKKRTRKKYQDRILRAYREREVTP